MTQYLSRIQSITLHTEKMFIDWIASFVQIELNTTVFASIAIDMIIAIQGDDSNRFRLAIGWENRSMANVTSWSKFLMKTIDAMNVHSSIDCKRNAVETFVTKYAGKTFGMIRLACGSKNLQQSMINDRAIFHLSLTRSVMGCAHATHFSNEF